MIGTCCVCGGTVIDYADGRATMRPTYTQLELRLNTLQNHTTPFCQACAATLTPRDYPVVLERIKATYEHAWAVKHVPDVLRRQHRDEMAAWQIIGLASEIEGLEHGRARPLVTLHACGTPVTDRKGKPYCKACKRPATETRQVLGVVEAPGA